MTKHFGTWSKIVLPEAVRLGQKIAYMDLYCGPGCYDDGTESTPLLILKTAIASKDLGEHLVTVFNDKKRKSIKKLKEEVKKLDGIDRLKNQPVILNEKVSFETEKLFVNNTRMPTFTFLDPFGYKGLSRNLIESLVTKAWGCDCIFFFSYSSINRALSAGYFTTHMEALFGEKRAAELEVKMQSIEGSDYNKPREREAIILDALKDALEELNNGKMFVRTFRFKKGLRTSHMLVFVTTHSLGFRVMSDIMAQQGFVDAKGIPHFTHYTRPPPKNRLYYIEYDRLQRDLCEKYSGKRMKMIDIFLDHRQYTASNYKDALNALEAKGLITVEPPAKDRKMMKEKRTFKDEALVTFHLRKK